MSKPKDPKAPKPEPKNVMEAAWVHGQIDSQNIPYHVSVKAFIKQQMEDSVGRRFATEEMRDSVLKSVAAKFNESYERLNNPATRFNEREVTVLAGFLGFRNPSLVELVSRTGAEDPTPSFTLGPDWRKRVPPKPHIGLQDVLDYANAVTERLQHHHEMQDVVAAAPVYVETPEDKAKPTIIGVDVEAVKARIAARKAAEAEEKKAQKKASQNGAKQTLGNGKKPAPKPRKDEPPTNGRKR